MILGAVVRRLGIEQVLKGDGKIGIAGVQRCGCSDVGGRHVIQHDDVGRDLLAAQRGFAGDLLFDQPQARLDMLDQGYDVLYHRAVRFVSVVGFNRDAAAFEVAFEVALEVALEFALGILHSRTPQVTFLGARCYLCVKPSSRTNTGAF